MPKYTVFTKWFQEHFKTSNDPMNDDRAFDTYKAWECARKQDEALIKSLVEAGTILLCNSTPIKTGAVIVSSEIHNRHLKRLGEAIQQANKRLKEQS